jgi:hypothetical protein
MITKHHSLLRKAKLLLVILSIIPVICASQISSLPQTGSENTYSYIFPLKQGEKGSRYITDQNDKPFFWLGDAAWSLIAQLSRDDVDFYLDNRKEMGFSVVLVSLIEHKFCTNAPANHYGDLPFEGRLFSTPNPKYFDNADYVIEAASKRNIIVLLAPLYLGYDCKDEGWCAEVKAASDADLSIWGKYIGNRYSKFKNIVWIIGGDTDPSPVREKVLKMVNGIREYDTIHLFTAHNRPETMAISPWEGESWMNINNVYTYDSIIYRQLKKAYDIKPAVPFYLVESAYENEHNATPQELRSQAYTTLLSGSMGHIFGNCPVWHFGSFKSWCNITDWKTELNNKGSIGMFYFQKLFRLRSWHTLIPDFDHTVITAGYGKWGYKDYVCAARTKDGNTIIAYLPSSREITADLSKVAGKKARCWWYEPSSGKAFNIGTFNSDGTKNFTPASNGDWVLVIDNEDADLIIPGMPQ